MKLTSWASIVEKNSSKKVTQKEMKSAVKSAMKKRDRECNIIMFNVEELDEDYTSENRDAETALVIMNRAGRNEFDGEFATEGIGRVVTESNRPLKVRFDYKSCAFDLLANLKNLKYDANNFNVFLVPESRREDRARKISRVVKTQNKLRPS